MKNLILANIKIVIKWQLSKKKDQNSPQKKEIKPK